MSAIVWYLSQKARNLHKFKLKYLATTATLGTQRELKMLFYDDNSLNTEKVVKSFIFPQKAWRKTRKWTKQAFKIYLQFIYLKTLLQIFFLIWPTSCCTSKSSLHSQSFVMKCLTGFRDKWPFFLNEWPCVTMIAIVTAAAWKPTRK